MNNGRQVEEEEKKDEREASRLSVVVVLYLQTHATNNYHYDYHPPRERPPELSSS